MTAPTARVQVDGKFFTAGGRRFPVRGVTYGTFSTRADGALFPEREGLKRDLSAMAEAGFTVVRTYTLPPDDLLDLAADWDLRLLAGAFWPDWRYLLGASRRQHRRLVAEARDSVREAARRLAGAEQVMALVLGNEVPADVVRWVGAGPVGAALAELAAVVKEEDERFLVTYGNYPTSEYLPLEAMDFLTFNVFLENPVDFRRYLTRLHHLAGDRPVVLGELGASAGPGPEGEEHQARMLDWQLGTALERGMGGTCVFSWTDEWWVADRRVEGWSFGLTRADRSPRPSLDVARTWNGRTVADLEDGWPSLSVVVCAYNAASTLDECLTHTCGLDYPDLDIVVVDDGSTDETAAIARRHPRARLVGIPHAGLSVARNEGWRAARGRFVAYLDSDAYPPPEWPYYLVLGFDGPMVTGGGGPNVPPRSDGTGARQVALASGGPVHVLLSDDRAEHVPGCNMAFLRETLEEVGGFDPVYTSAGDDVDVCWRVLDRGYEIGFHPAASVWHHRRSGLRPYLRQQRGYGRAEALVESRHPDRFTPLGTARWQGHIYGARPAGRGRIYRGLYGLAPYQSVYRSRSHGLDIAHQVGVPAAAGVLASGLAAVWDLRAGLPALVAALFLAGLFLADVVRSRPAPGTAGIRFGAGVAAMCLLQPLARLAGRASGSAPGRRGRSRPAPLLWPARRLGRGAVLLSTAGDRGHVVTELVAAVRARGIRVASPTGWEDYDATLAVSALVHGLLVTSAHPDGFVQARARPRALGRRWAAAGALAVVLGLVWSPLAAAVAAVALGEGGRGWLRTRALLPRVCTTGGSR